MAACAGGDSGAAERTFEVADGEDAFAGHGNSKLLGAQELAIYHADRKYVRGLAKRGIAMAINHADPRQHRFAVARMKLAGKTAESSPELFRQMDRLRVTHAAQGLVPGQMQPMAAVDDGSLQSQHAMLITGKLASSGVAVSGAMASRRPALSYGYVDCNVYDGNGNALGDTSYTEIFGNLAYLTPRCQGDPAFAEVPSLEGDSFLTENLLTSNVMNQSYIVGEVVTNDVGDPTLGTPTIAHPVDSNGDGKIIICLDRADGGCEYPGVGARSLRIPLQGSVTITNATFDLNMLGRYQRGEDSGSAIFVTLGAATRGGCALPRAAQTFSMVDFWKSVSYSTNQISWDLRSNNNWAVFSTDCRLVQDRVDLTMRLHLPFLAPGYGGFQDIEISSATAETAPNYHLPYPVQITNSCLAAGTRITTGDGVTRNIEDVRIGDVVTNPFARALTVADLSVGIERSPMVHVVDSRGHQLVMTEKHPLSVADRGMVAAAQLKIGDEIATIDGPAWLVAITRESYGGKVYNLKLGTAEQAMALGIDQTVMYANGILVGDSQIQTRHEFMDLRARAAHDALPERWRADYLSSRTGARR